MSPGGRWLTATWPVVRACLPATPARVVEVGCGPLGGFVPMLRANRYDAVVASTSLHHVADPAQVIDRITNTLKSGGALVVVEWGDEEVHLRTAAWCCE